MNPNDICIYIYTYHTLMCFPLKCVFVQCNKIREYQPVLLLLNNQDWKWSNALLVLKFKSLHKELKKFICRFSWSFLSLNSVFCLMWDVTEITDKWQTKSFIFTRNPARYRDISFDILNWRHKAHQSYTPKSSLTAEIMPELLKYLEFKVYVYCVYL